MRLSVVIVSWNTRKMTLNCLSSLELALKSDGLVEKSEIIVVDNGSVDRTASVIKKNFPAVRLKVNKKNLGFGRANNQGIKLAKGEFVLLLNSDTLVPPGNLKKMIDYLSGRPEVGVVGPKLLNKDGTDQPSAGHFPDLLTVALMLFGERFFKTDRVRSSFTKTKPVDWVMGAAMLCRAEVLKEVGGFDEKIFMYMEEVEMCYRIKKKGWLVVYFSEVVITHFGGGSSRSGRKEPILDIYRGLKYFYQNHYGLLSYLFLRLMLKIKAVFAYTMGVVTGNQYLQETYAEAYRLV